MNTPLGSDNVTVSHLNMRSNRLLNKL